MSQKNKIQLVTLKNNKPTKNSLKVKPKILFDELKKKIGEIFTKKEFRLEYFSKQDNQWHRLQKQQAFKLLISNYNQQPINIITEQERNQNSDQSHLTQSQYNQSLTSDNSQVLSRDSSIIQDSELSKTLKSNESSLKEEVSENLSKYSKDFQKKQIFYEKGTDFDITVKEIINIFSDIAVKQMHQKYQIIKQKEASIDLGKSCSQCKAKEFKGPYFICLICVNQYVLCSQCQAKEILPGKGLQTHPARSHPFAKIKRFSQTIESKKVTTYPETELQFKDRSQNRLPRLGTLVQTEQQINNRLLDKFNSMYAELIQKSKFHQNNYYNPTNTPYSVRRPDNHLKIQSLRINNQSKLSQQKQLAAVLSDIDKQRKFKRLKRMGLSQEQVKKYTSGDFQNKAYSEVIKQIYLNR